MVQDLSHDLSQRVLSMSDPLLPVNGNGLVNEELKPVLGAVAMPRNEVDVSFERGDMHGILIETMVDGGSWTYAGRYFISPATIKISNGTGRPRSVEIRARYVKGMEPVGLDSDPVSVVTTP